MLQKKNHINFKGGWLVTEKFKIGKEDVEICQSLEVQSASNVHNIFCLYVFENNTNNAVNVDCFVCLIVYSVP